MYGATGDYTDCWIRNNTMDWGLFDEFFVAFDEIVGAGEDSKSESEVESDETEDMDNIVLEDDGREEGN